MRLNSPENGCRSRRLWGLTGLLVLAASLSLTCSGTGLFSSLSSPGQASPTADELVSITQTDIARRQDALAMTSTAMSNPLPTQTSPPAITPQAEILPPTQMPPTAAVQPAGGEELAGSQTLTGSQALEGMRLFDDFSSDALGWPVFDDGLTILKYENEAYNFQITRPDYYDWVFLPVDFLPYEMEFDVQVLTGPQDGTFGVFCQFQDEQNYYYAEFDFQAGTYVLGQVINGDNDPLTIPDVDGQFWRSAPMLKSPPAVNHISLGCYLSDITLSINNEFVDLVFIPVQFETPGKAAFFLYTKSGAGQDGYSVQIDNVETYQPVQ